MRPVRRAHWGGIILRQTKKNMSTDEKQLRVDSAERELIDAQASLDTLLATDWSPGIGKTRRSIMSAARSRLRLAEKRMNQATSA